MTVTVTVTVEIDFPDDNFVVNAEEAALLIVDGLKDAIVDFIDDTNNATESGEAIKVVIRRDGAAI